MSTFRVICIKSKLNSTEDSNFSDGICIGQQCEKYFQSLCMRAVWKVHGLATVRRCYASPCITAAHCRQSTNFSNGRCSRSNIQKSVLLNDHNSNSDDRGMKITSLLCYPHHYNLA
jgi:hypothetical protein